MAVLTYATADDLAAWTGSTAPSNATQLLRSASLLVAQFVANDWYAVDDDGYPTDTALRQALRDATTEQAASWAALGINPAAGAAGATRQAIRTRIGTAQVDYGSSAEGRNSDDQAAAATQLSPGAFQILRLAGVGTNQVLSW